MGMIQRDRWPGARGRASSSQAALEVCLGFLKKGRDSVRGYRFFGGL
jgi:hypothetical protein